MKLLLVFIVFGKYNYIFYAIEICNKKYIYLEAINLKEQSKYKKAHSM